MGKLSVDLELVKKYNVAGPRYTSYPPAPHFTSDVTWPHLEECIRKNNESDPGLSLYFHIPFCHSLCWFCGCTTIITRQQSQSATYI